jgi:exopolysaccharide production protein ExoY
MTAEPFESEADAYAYVALRRNDARLHLAPDHRRGVARTPVVVRSRCVGWRRGVKRIVDVTVGSLLLVLLSPLFAAVAVLTKLSSRGPILFRQPRIGRGRETFEILKFRTMHTDSAARLVASPELWERYVDNDFKLPIEEDPRITRLGRVLRRSSLDELPQLLNVLNGEMSLVGPRPVVAEELAQYGSLVDAYTAVRPGITGRWQTEGRNAIRYPERAVLDAAYVEHFRLRDDVRILWRTVPAVLGRSGVH